MLMWFKVQKTHYFPHTVHYFCSSLPRLSEMRWFLQSSSFWKTSCALIGQLSSALWLAEYLKRVTEMLRPLQYLETHCLHDMAAAAKILQWEYKLCLLSLRKHLGSVMQSVQHSDVDMWGVFKWGIFGRCGRVLTFKKNISLGLRL